MSESSPLGDPVAAEIFISPEAINRATVKLSGTRVLVVDDSTTSRQVAQAMLQAVGCRVDMATGGMEALQIIGDGTNHDVVLMDLNMPHPDGIEATSKMRQMGLRLPVIAVTARAEAEVTELEGFDDYLLKPVIPVLLYDRLVRALGLDPVPEEATVAPVSDNREQQNVPVVDDTIILKLRDAVGAAFPSLLAGSVEELRARLSDLAAVRVDDTRALRFIAHDLRSAAGTLGALRLAQAVAALGRAVAAEDTEERERARSLVLAEAEQAEPELENVRRRLTRSV